MGKFQQINTELLPFFRVENWVSVLYLAHFLDDCLQTLSMS